MRSYKESPMTRELCAKLEAWDCCVLPLVANSMSKPGWPDRYVAFAINKRLQFQGWVEFKSSVGKLSKVQARVIQDLRSARVIVIVASFSKDGSHISLNAGHGVCQNVRNSSSAFIESLCDMSRQVEECRL